MIGTIRQKTYLFLGIFICALLFQTVSQYLHNDVMSEKAIYIADTQSKIQKQLHNLQISTIQIQQWLTDISATRGQDGLNDGFDEASASADQFRKAVNQLILLDTHSGIRYQELIPLMEAYYAAGEAMAREYIRGGAPAGNKLMGDFDDTAVAIYGRIDEISEIAQLEAKKTLQSQLAETEIAQQMNLFYSAMYFTLLLLLLFGVQKFVLRPVNSMMNMAKDLAHGEGDLTQRLSVTRNDELAELARSLNAFIERTDIMVSDLMKSIVRLVPMSKEMSQTNNQIHASSINQQSHSKKLSDHMTHTQTAASEVSQRSDQISDSVKASSKTLNECQTIAIKTSQSIGELRNEIEEMSTAISGLSENSERIGSIIDVINSISDQTNLLALNAAIEAARAGEAGRGFAVVADEVRSLASRTREATVEVQTMIESIQDGTQQVKQTVDRGIESAQSGVENVRVTTDNLNNLVKAVDNINSQAQDIKNEIGQQNAYFSQAFESVELMEKDLQISLKHVEDNCNFESDLKSLSAKVKGMISKFKVTDKEYSEKVRTEKRGA